MWVSILRRHQTTCRSIREASNRRKGTTKATEFSTRQGSNANSTPHFYRNKMPHQQQGSSNRKFGHRGGRRGFHHQQQQQRQFNDNKNVDTYSQYFHSSMLEDPWHELMERFNAIYGIVVDDEQQKRDSDT
ncbi:hypothetical protein ACLKA6_011983 [Drosophila palustris]